MSGKILKLALEKPWSCTSRNCKQPATHIWVKRNLKAKTFSIDFLGKCEKHKNKECLTLQELRQIIKDKYEADQT